MARMGKLLGYKGHKSLLAWKGWCFICQKERYILKLSGDDHYQSCCNVCGLGFPISKDEFVIGEKQLQDERNYD